MQPLPQPPLSPLPPKAYPQATSACTSLPSRSRWPGVSQVEWKTIGEHRFAVLVFASHDELQAAVNCGQLGLLAPGTPPDAAGAGSDAMEDAGSGPGADDQDRDSADSPDGADGADGDDVDMDSESGTDACGCADAAPPAEPEANGPSSKGGKVAGPKPVPPTAATMASTAAATPIRVHPSKVYPLDFFWYAALSLGDFVTPISPGFAKLQVCGSWGGGRGGEALSVAVQK